MPAPAECIERSPGRKPPPTRPSPSSSSGPDNKINHAGLQLLIRHDCYKGETSAGYRESVIDLWDVFRDQCQQACTGLQQKECRCCPRSTTSTTTPFARNITVTTTPTTTTTFKSPEETRNCTEICHWNPGKKCLPYCREQAINNLRVDVDLRQY
ncbi:hypothetical protein M3Y99_01360900 [Aphelenchoides fujianensis]|nr:hypothetical protein M3Y99_01360900 [Aphelenchoides fujianensis]